MKKTSWSGRGRRTSFCLLLATGVALAMGASAAEPVETFVCRDFKGDPTLTCPKVKRHPLDPEAVFGDDWKHSDWAYTQEFADRLQVKDRGQINNNLPRGLAAVELRVTWNPRFLSYSCGVNAFIEDSLLSYVKLPEGQSGTSPGTFPNFSTTFPEGKGIRDASDRIARADQVKKYSDQSGQYYFLIFDNGVRKANFGGTGGQLLGYSRQIMVGMGYVMTEANCQLNKIRPSQHGELWLPAAKTEGAPVPIVRHGDKSFLVLSLPPDLLLKAHPYWRRASEISYCYGRAEAPLDPWRPGAREQFMQGCDALRRSPIDGIERDPMQLR